MRRPFVSGIPRFDNLVDLRDPRLDPEQLSANRISIASSVGNGWESRIAIMCGGCASVGVRVTTERSLGAWNG